YVVPDPLNANCREWRCNIEVTADGFIYFLMKLDTFRRCIGRYHQAVVLHENNTGKLFILINIRLYTIHNRKGQHEPGIDVRYPDKTVILSFEYFRSQFASVFTAANQVSINRMSMYDMFFQNRVETGFNRRAQRLKAFHGDDVSADKF